MASNRTDGETSQRCGIIPEITGQKRFKLVNQRPGTVLTFLRVYFRWFEIVPDVDEYLSRSKR